VSRDVALSLLTGRQWLCNFGCAQKACSFFTLAPRQVDLTRRNASKPHIFNHPSPFLIWKKKCQRSGLKPQLGGRMVSTSNFLKRASS
jgi:hypothetical protein